MVNDAIGSALPRLRTTLRREQLSIAAEITIAHRVKLTLGIDVPACRILLIDNPAFLLETTAIDRTCGIFIPMHLVVSAAGNRTLVHMLNLEHIRRSDLPIGIRAPVMDLQRQILRALARIAQRLPFIQDPIEVQEKTSAMEKSAI
jgi:uncharacterized protein (DUF302 family)